MSNSVKAIPSGYQTATPYLTLKDTSEAIDFYKRAFGAVEIFRMNGPDGKIAHAEIRIGNSPLMLGDESPSSEAKAPESLNGTTSGIFLYVDDVDASFKRALDAGARQTVPLQNMFWGDRFGRLTDPFGHKWMLASHVEDVSPAEMEERMCAAVGAK